MSDHVKAAATTIELGCSAVELVQRLPDLFPDIQNFVFRIYAPMPGVGYRVSEFLHTEQRSGEYNELVKQYRYWEFMIEALYQAKNPRDAVRNILSHDESHEQESRRTATNQDLRTGWLTAAVEQLSADTAIALCSSCRRKSGADAHIPLMDFNCPVNQKNLDLIRTMLEELGQSQGVILESGRSYHFYGFELLSDVEWIKFLGAALLLAPFIDSRYIGHRLMGGMSVLRLTPAPKTGFVPHVVAVMDN